MPLLFLPDQSRSFRGAPPIKGSEFESKAAAWAEMTKVSGNLLGSIARSLQQNAEWQMELLDEAKEPVFRIRLISESVGASFS